MTTIGNEYQRKSSKSLLVRQFKRTVEGVAVHCVIPKYKKERHQDGQTLTLTDTDRQGVWQVIRVYWQSNKVSGIWTGSCLTAAQLKRLSAGRRGFGRMAAFSPKLSPSPCFGLRTHSSQFSIAENWEICREHIKFKARKKTENLGEWHNMTPLITALN